MLEIRTAAGLAFGVIFACGFACLLLPPGRRHGLTLALVTLGLSLGGLTLVMFWIAWLFPGRLNWPTTVIVCAALGGFGLYLARGKTRPDPMPQIFERWSAFRDPLALALLISVVVLSAAILFNALYWPFSDWDALAIYAPLGRRLYETGALPTGTLYAGYPMLVPLAYAYTHGSAGTVSESWARLVPALMAIGAIGAAAALGREMHSWRVGLGAAALVALTPLFGRWASSGYVDVPASLFFGLTALGAWRWTQSGTRQDALLTGAMAGLGMWTKSAALTLWVSLAALALLHAWIRGQDRSGTTVSRAGFSWIAAAILITAGPWYARNLTLFGYLVPDTIWTSQARHDLSSLLVMLDLRQHFLATGWLFTVSLVYAVAAFVCRGMFRVSVWHVLLACVAPFLAAWWWLASYDPRFLVIIVPLLAVMAAVMMGELSARWADRPSWARTRTIGWIGALLVVVATPFALQKAVAGKRAILENPWMSGAEKHRLLLGGLYDLALAINALPGGSRVRGVPAPALYHLDSAHLDSAFEAPSDAPPWDLAPDFDYVVYRFVDGQFPAWAVDLPTVFETTDGYYLYSTHASSMAASYLTPRSVGR